MPQRMSIVVVEVAVEVDAGTHLSLPVFVDHRIESNCFSLRRLCVVLLPVIVLNSVASSSASAACSQRFDDRLHLPPNSTFLSLSARSTHAHARVSSNAKAIDMNPGSFEDRSFCLFSLLAD